MTRDNLIQLMSLGQKLVSKELQANSKNIFNFT